MQGSRFARYAILSFDSLTRGCTFVLALSLPVRSEPPYTRLVERVHSDYDEDYGSTSLPSAIFGVSSDFLPEDVAIEPPQPIHYYDTSLDENSEASRSAAT